MSKHKIQNKHRAEVSNAKTPVLIFVVLVLSLFCSLIPDFSIEKSAPGVSEGSLDQTRGEFGRFSEVSQNFAAAQKKCAGKILGYPAKRLKTSLRFFAALRANFARAFAQAKFGLNFVVCRYSFAQDSGKEEEAVFLAKKAIEDGFYDVALGLLERFKNNYPNSSNMPEAELLTGRCYFHQNKYLDALTKFEGLLNQPSAKDIRDAVLYWIAEVHFKGNCFSKAASYYKMLIEEFPKSEYCSFAYYSLGWCLFQERQFKQALEYFNIVEEKFPKEPQAQDSSFKVIECLYNLKEYPALKEKIKSYSEANPKDAARFPYLNFYLAEADYYLDNFGAAFDEYSRAISGASDERIEALSKLGMGWCCLKQKRYKEAEDVFMELKADNLEKANQTVFLLGKALLMFETKRFDEAKRIYDELINKPSEPVVLFQAYIGKADVFYNMADYKEAVKVYKEALAKVDCGSLPREILDKLHYGLSWALLKEGEFKEAIEYFQKIVQTTDDKIVKVSALCQIGDAYQDSGDYKKAQETYDRILKDYPDSLYGDYVQYQLGIAMLKSSNYDGAIMSFLKLKRNFPDSKLLDDATYALGLTYFQRQDYNSSKEVFQKFQEEFRDSNLRPQVTYLLGTSLYNMGKFEEAIEVFKTLMKLYNSDTDLIQKAEYEIADCFYQMGNEKEAMNRFKVLRSKYPDSKLTPEVMWWLGEYYYRHNDLNLARRYFSSLIRDFPKSSLIPDAYYALGSTYSDEGLYQEAIDNFKKVVELDRLDLSGTAAIAISDIYVKENKFDLALDTYKGIVRGHPNLASLIFPKMAGIYFNMNKFDDALELYQKSLEIVPAKETSDIQFKIAETLEAQGKIQEAIEEYLKVTYLYQENGGLTVKALLRVAAAYENKENFKEAENIYRRIISMNTEEAKYAQERIDWIKAHVK